MASQGKGEQGSLGKTMRGLGIATQSSALVQYYLSGWEQFIAFMTDVVSKMIKSICILIVNYQQNRELFILTRNTVDEETEGNTTVW